MSYKKIFEDLSKDYPGKPIAEAFDQEGVSQSFSLIEKSLPGALIVAVGLGFVAPSLASWMVATAILAPCGALAYYLNRYEN